MKIVITYKYTSHGVCGATLGASGTGEYAIIIEGDDMKAFEKAQELVSKMNRGYSDIVIVTSEERYHGTPITEYKV